MPTFHTKSDDFQRLLLILELLLLTLTFLLATRLYPYLRPGESIDLRGHLGFLPIILATFAISRKIPSGAVLIAKRTLGAQSVGLFRELGATLAVSAGLIFFLHLEYFSRAVLVSFAIIAIIVLIANRLFLVWWYFKEDRDNPENHLNVLIIGSGRRAHSLADKLVSSSEWGIKVVGFLDPTGKSAGRRAEDGILGHVDKIETVLRENVVDEVIVAVPRSLLGDVQSIIDSCQEEGVRLRFMADIYAFQAARIRLTMMDDIPLLSFEPVARAENALFAKRIFDLVVTLASMPILLPILVLVAIAIRLDSAGPIFFVQDRIGLHKRSFRMYKFRSMVPDAEQRMNEVEHLNEADGPSFKIENDPRITRFGRVIRRTSIDELPQLFNVILGEMSLVGPRPMSKRDVKLFDKGKQRKRFSVRPGITCLWQVSGRSNLSFDDWLRLDLQYIESWSFWLDLKILFKTLPTVLKGNGAV